MEHFCSTPVSLMDLTSELFRRSNLVDEAIEELKVRAREAAGADHEYRLSRARAFLATSGNIPEREAQATIAVGDLRRIAKTAEDLKMAAAQSLKARTTQLSAVQTMARAVQAERDLARTGPQ